jgi:hypothetical protein
MCQNSRPSNQKEDSDLLHTADSCARFQDRVIRKKTEKFYKTLLNNYAKDEVIVLIF